MTVIQGIGIGIIILVLVFNGIALARKWFKTKGQITYAIVMALLGLLVGIVMIFNERVTEMSLKVVGAGGTVKTALKEVRSDANEITQIKERILTQAATIDAAFSTAAEARRLSERLSNNIVEAETALKRFETNSSLLDLVTGAFAGDRRAWDKLGVIANDANHSFQSRALYTWSAVIELHNPTIPNQVFPRYPGILIQSGLSSETASLGELLEVFQKLAWSEKRELMRFIAEATRFKRKEKLEFFLRIRETDDSLHI